MTEEDQILVAKAALHGARIHLTLNYWVYQNSQGGYRTIGRAASAYLYAAGLQDFMTHREYMARTETPRWPEDVDFEAMAMALAAPMPDGPATVETENRAARTAATTEE